MVGKEGYREPREELLDNLARLHPLLLALVISHGLEKVEVADAGIWVFFDVGELRDGP